MLVKQGIVTFDDACVQESNSEVPSSTAVEEVIQLLANWKATLTETSSQDAEVIFAVSGYVTKAVKCTCFKKSSTVSRDYFDKINRGGWVEPTELVLYVCFVAYVAFSILTSKSNKQFFLKQCMHRNLFISAVSSLAPSDTNFDHKCNHLHKIISIFFNCMAKNYISFMKDTLFDTKKRSSVRKISKLASNCTE